MKRGFWTGLGVGAAGVALALGLTGCITTKTIQVPANADATCSVVTHPGGGTTK